MSPGRPGRVPGLNIEKAVGCGAAVSHHLMGGVSVRVNSPPASSVGLRSWTRVKSALGKLILEISVMTTSCIFPISLVMVDRSRSVY